MEQRSLFDPPAGREAFEPCDPSVPEAERPRLSRQCQAILERLQHGPATNRELAGLALKYSGRISDLRKAGHDVRVWSHEHRTGLVVYGIGPPPGGQS